MRRGAALLALVPALLFAPPALAQKDDVARARVLANQGGDLLDKKEYDAALRKIEEAEALYHAPTHLLMMGQAQEGLGRLAAAAATYERLASEPLPAKGPAAFKRAQEEGQKRLRELLSRVPSILVEVHGAEAFEAQLDGQPFEARRGVATRVDPGKHVLSVSAPDRQPVQKAFELPEKGGVVKIEIALSEAPSAAAAASPPDVPGDVPPPDSREPAPSRAPAIVAFALGAAGIGVGAVTGVMSLSRVGELEDRCPSGKCGAAEQETIDSAGTLGTISTIGFIAGGVGVAAGVVLLVALPSGKGGPPADARAATLAPVVHVAGDSGFAGVRGRF